MAPQREWFEKDYYAVLGVGSGASDKELTKAYRKLAKALHPDANPGDAKAEERFKEVSAAHDVLSDPERRKEYDEVRSLVASGVGPEGPGRGGFGGFGGGGGFRGAGGQTFTFDDLGDMGDGGGLGDLLGGLFVRGGGAGGRRGGARTQARAPRKGADLETELHVDFLDAVRGVTTEVNFTAEAVCSVCHGSGAEPGTTPETCPECGGSGQVLQDQGPFSFAQVCSRCGGRGEIVKNPCHQCGGRGTEMRPRSVKVRVPAGVDDGQRIRVKGRGAPGGPGGQPGDLYVVVHVHPHALFGRKGKHLTLSVPVTFPEATLGATVRVPTLDAPVSVRVPAGTKSGTTVRVRGRGVPMAKGGPGDLLVTFELDVPAELDDDARAALDALAAVLPGDPRAHLGV